MRTQSKTDQPTYGAYRLTALGTNEIAAKKSFLVFSRNKYITVATDAIAYFYVKNEYAIIVCFDKQEYSVNYSLEHIQNVLSELQFFRLNRQYLINFNAVKEVEHYFARKLLVKLVVPVIEKLLVSKEKGRSFLRWLENR
jgi:DNA-binding LytR/AlgR family response regulator